MSAEKITAVGANIAEKATMIWNVADMLRGPFEEQDISDERRALSHRVG